MAIAYKSSTYWHFWNVRISHSTSPEIQAFWSVEKQQQRLFFSFGRVRLKMFELIILKILLQSSISLLHSVLKCYISILYIVKNLDKMTFKPLSSKKKKSNIYFSPFRQATKVHSPPPPLPKCEEAKKRPLTPDNSWVPNKCCHYWPRDRAMVLKAWNLFLFSL